MKLSVQLATITVFIASGMMFLFGCASGRMSEELCETMSNIRSVAIAAEGAASIENRYPPSCFLDSCRTTELFAIRNDSWGTPLHYIVSEDRQAFAIVSAGRDRQFVGYDIASVTPMTPRKIRRRDADDIVFSNGIFVRLPAAAAKDSACRPEASGDP